MPGGWDCLSRHDGGSVFALATTRAEAHDLTRLFAATAAGLYVSENAGRRWSAAGDMPLPLLAAVVPSARFADNRVLFAGTQTGFYRSKDAGRTWQQTLSECHVFTIACVHDGDTDHLFIGTERDGILRSDDAGRTWTGANPGLLDRTVLALAFSPDASRDQTGFAATASGLYRTRNGGKSWREVESPRDETAVQCLAVSPTFGTDRLVLAGTEADGLWRSDDGGATWDIVPGLPECGIGAIAFSRRYADAHRIAAATTNGIALSHNGGETWRLTGQELPLALSLAFVPDGDGETLVAGLHREGAARLDMTTDDARWIAANAGLGATLLTTLVASPTFARDRTLFVAGPEAGVRVSRDGGCTWLTTGDSLTDAVVQGLAIAPTPEGNRIVFAAIAAGITRSRDDGATWEAPTERSDVPCSIVVATRAATGDEVAVYAATLDGNIIACHDGGTSWHVLDSPFVGATILSVVCSPNFADDRTLYVGTQHTGTARDDVTITIWRSTDGGKHWARWFEDRGGGETLPIAAPPHSGRSGRDDGPFVGFAGQVMRPRRNAWQTRDDARYPLWSGPTLATTRAPATINALSVSPNYDTDGMIFAATSAGVYRSRIHGRTFEWWSDNLLPTPVLAIAAVRVDTSGDAPALVFALGADGTIWQRASDD